MGKQGGQGENDDELWERVAKTAQPLGQRGPKAKAERPKPSSAPRPKEVDLAPRPHAKHQPKPRPAHTPAGVALDRQTSRQLEKGRLAVEARLDLHGMRQREAHAALRRFLKSAQGKGYRHVLVITGKGAAPDARSFYEEDERGVLRQAVPHWLSQPDLAPLVVSYSAAPRRLGGEGALYVRLRKAQTTR